ncbi:MAG: Uma2 family endonuclease [Planctomycetia bacterium]|nr:Uma2 family endonuclease [Planctomycetia bacterium]
MVMLVVEPRLEETLKAERRASGADRWDEVWDGVYFMSPLPNIEHQLFVGMLTATFQNVLDAGKRGTAYPGINVSDREDDWAQNYRCPDVAVFLTGSPARNLDTHWCGGPDFAVEIVSLDDRSREKLEFYARVGVRELLIVDRDPWALEMYRLEAGELRMSGKSTVDSAVQLQSEVLPLNFRLVRGDARPQIEISHHDGRQQWRI